jgi:hypothetical protein
LIIATRKIADLSGDDAARIKVARYCLEVAGRRYSELTDFLKRRRLALPPPAWPDPDETPE